MKPIPWSRENLQALNQKLQAKRTALGIRTDGSGPCSHPGCMHHVSHPCEGCGRQWGQGKSITSIPSTDKGKSCQPQN